MLRDTRQEGRTDRRDFERQLRKLKKDGLVEYEPYLGAKLGPKGKRMAKELMKKHKVLADLLEIIGVSRDLAEVDACKIEHHVSKETLERLEKFVDFVVVRHLCLLNKTVVSVLPA